MMGMLSTRAYTAAATTASRKNNSGRRTRGFRAASALRPFRVSRSRATCSSTSCTGRRPKRLLRISSRRVDSSAMAASWAALHFSVSARPALSLSRASRRWRLRLSVTCCSSCWHRCRVLSSWASRFSTSCMEPSIRRRRR